MAEEIKQEVTQEVTKEESEKTTEQVFEDYKAKSLEKAQVTQEQVDAWKKEYGKVFMIQFNGDVYIHRCISRAEYKEMATLGVDERKLEEWVCDKCVLYPSNFAALPKDTMPAGIITSISKSIEANSGFQPDTAPIEL